MNKLLPELRLQEERTFLQSMLQEGSKEPPPSWQDSCTLANIPKAFTSGNALCVSNSPMLPR